MRFENVPDGYQASLLKLRFKWPTKNLILVTGKPDTGKTHGVIDLCYRGLKQAAAKGNVDRNMIARYVTHAGIMTEYNECRDNDGSGASVIRKYQNGHILIIDEFCSHGSDTRDALNARTEEIVWARMEKLHHFTFLITNRGVNDPSDLFFEQHLSERFLSRLSKERGQCQVIELTALAEKDKGKGPPHKLPEPVWMNNVLVLLNDVTMHRQPVSIKFLGVGRTWFIHDRLNDPEQFPAEAWEWMESSKMLAPVMPLIQEIKAWVAPVLPKVERQAKVEFFA